MEFLRTYDWLMILALVLVQGMMVFLCWPRPIYKGHYRLLFLMTVMTCLPPLLFSLVASEVYK